MPDPEPAPDTDQELDRLRREGANSQIFARMLAHDLNNLLGCIVGHASLMEAIAEPGGELQASAEVIAKAAARATDLVRQIQGFSGPAAVVRSEPVDLVHIVAEVAGLVGRGGLRVETDLGAGPVIVTGDAAQLYQMVLNLAVNARDAVEPESGVIMFRLIASAGQAELSVADNGRGIPADIRDRIFDPFVSGKASGGVGLGLAIVRGVVESHSGSIAVESASPGTRFTVRLPLRK